MDIGVDLSKPPILTKSHKFYGSEYDDGEKVIFLIRDYKECMTRHAIAERWKGSYDEKAIRKFDSETKGKNSAVDYIEVLQHYDKWPKEKLLLYYEDLMTKPKIQIDRIAELFSIDKKRVHKMFQNYNRHFNSGIQVYHARSITKGKKLTQHQDKLKPATRKYMINQIKNNHPEIYKKYLSRYG
jgi:hypothetical protein